MHSLRELCWRADGRKVVIFGGEGYRLDDAGEGPSPCVYILDVDTLTWQRCFTHTPVEAHSPGARSLHVTTVRPDLPCTRQHAVLSSTSPCFPEAQFDRTFGGMGGSDWLQNLSYCFQLRGNSEG